MSLTEFLSDLTEALSTSAGMNMFIEGLDDSEEFMNLAQTRAVVNSIPDDMISIILNAALKYNKMEVLVKMIDDVFVDDYTSILFVRKMLHAMLVHNDVESEMIVTFIREVIRTEMEEKDWFRTPEQKTRLFGFQKPGRPNEMCALRVHAFTVSDHLKLQVLYDLGFNVEIFTD